MVIQSQTGSHGYQIDVSLSMTLSDLERQDARGPILPYARIYRLTDSGPNRHVKHMGRGMH